MDDINAYEQIIEVLVKDVYFKYIPDDFVLRAFAEDPSWPYKVKSKAALLGIEHLHRINKRERELAPLLRELDTAGLLLFRDGHTASKLPDECIREAYPWLIKWFSLIEDSSARMWIAFKLENPAAANWIDELLELFRSQYDRCPDGDVWRIGATITEWGSKEYLEDYLELAQDKGFSHSRREFIRVLWRYRDDGRVLPILVNLAEFGESDPIVREALYALRRIADPATQSTFAKYVDHSDPDIRREARLGNSKIAKKVARTRSN